MRSTSLVLTAAFLVVLAACGGEPVAPPLQTGTISSTAPSFPATTPPPASPSTTAKPSAPSPPPQPPPGSGPCRSTTAWSTGLQEAAGSTTDALYLVRAGRHECFDRVVFDINGPADVGYFAQYVPLVRADGSGAPVPTNPATSRERYWHAPGITSTPSLSSRAGARCARSGSRVSSKDNARSPSAPGRDCRSVSSPSSIDVTRSAGSSWTSRTDQISTRSCSRATTAFQSYSVRSRSAIAAAASGSPWTR